MVSSGSVVAVVTISILFSSDRHIPKIIDNFIAAIERSPLETMKPLVKKKLLLEKYPGKGGWTYCRVPKLPKGSKNNFGFVKVKGTIDGYRISKYNIMPMKGGHHFLPVKSEIRKKIGKEAGQTVEVILYADHEPLKAPKELLECLADEPAALKFFKTLSDSNKKYYIEWIYSAKKEETKVDRIAKSIDRLSRGLKLYDTDQQF